MGNVELNLDAHDDGAIWAGAAGQVGSHEASDDDSRVVRRQRNSIPGIVRSADVGDELAALTELIDQPAVLRHQHDHAVNIARSALAASDCDQASVWQGNDVAAAVILVGDVDAGKAVVCSEGEIMLAVPVEPVGNEIDLFGR